MKETMERLPDGSIRSAAIMLLFLGVSGFADDSGFIAIQPPRDAIRTACKQQSRERRRCVFRVPVSGLRDTAHLEDIAESVARNWAAELTQRGWAVQQEAKIHHGLMVRLQRGAIHRAALTVTPAQRAAGGKMVPFIRAVCEQERAIPLHDRYGIDAPQIPRFPGSIRVRWMHIKDQFSARYLTTSAAETIREFFMTRLRADGWSERRSSADMTYTRGIAPSGTHPLYRLTIHIEEENGITAIGIGLTASDRSHIALPPVGNDLPSLHACDDTKILTDPQSLPQLPRFPGLIPVDETRELDPIRGEEVHRRRFRLEKTAMKTALDIADYYQQRLRDNGWVLFDQQWHGIGRTMEFHRQGVRATVHIQAVGRYPLPEKPAKITIPLNIVTIFSIPAEDVPGEDIAAVPRFPGSVRIYHLQAASSHVVKYKAPGCTDAVERFYVVELTNRGWRFSGYDQTGLLFVPGDRLQAERSAIPRGGVIPTTLKIVVDDHYDGSVKIGMDLTRGDR